MASTDVPNPGSPEAVAQGCICPRLDNANGRGWMGGVKDPETGETIFVYTVGCSVHAALVPTEATGTAPSSCNALDKERG